MDPGRALVLLAMMDLRTRQSIPPAPPTWSAIYWT
jgi:hypothetical protein